MNRRRRRLARARRRARRRVVDVIHSPCILAFERAAARALVDAHHLFLSTVEVLTLDDDGTLHVRISAMRREVPSVDEVAAKVRAELERVLAEMPPRR